MGAPNPCLAMGMCCHGWVCQNTPLCPTPGTNNTKASLDCPLWGQLPRGEAEREQSKLREGRPRATAAPTDGWRETVATRWVNGVCYTGDSCYAIFPLVCPDSTAGKSHRGTRKSTERGRKTFCSILSPCIILCTSVCLSATDSARQVSAAPNRAGAA